MPIAESVALGEDVVVHHPSLVNLYGCRIGDQTRIGSSQPRPGAATAAGDNARRPARGS